MDQSLDLYLITSDRLVAYDKGLSITECCVTKRGYVPFSCFKTYITNNHGRVVAYDTGLDHHLQSHMTPDHMVL